MKQFGITSWKDIVNNCIAYAWCSVDSGKGAKDLRNKRMELKKGATALEKSVNYWYVNVDKSGYIVDKDRLRKKLSSTRSEKYIKDLELISDMIAEVKDIISNYIMNLDSENAARKIATSILRSSI